MYTVYSQTPSLCIYVYLQRQKENEDRKAEGMGSWILQEAVLVFR